MLNIEETGQYLIISAQRDEEGRFIDEIGNITEGRGLSFDQGHILDFQEPLPERADPQQRKTARRIMEKTTGMKFPEGFWHQVFPLTEEAKARYEEIRKAEVGKTPPNK